MKRLCFRGGRGRNSSRVSTKGCDGDGTETRIHVGYNDDRVRGPSWVGRRGRKIVYRGGKLDHSGQLIRFVRNVPQPLLIVHGQLMNAISIQLWTGVISRSERSRFIN